jgi:hypothetical protein
VTRVGTSSFTQTTGWLVAIVVAATVLAAYVLRRRTRPPDFLVRMRPHFWLGGSVPVLTVIHLWPSMSSGMAAKVNTVGLDLATVAFLLSLVQVALGSGLRVAVPADNTGLRRLHIATMAGIVAFATGHMIANSGLFG